MLLALPEAQQAVHLGHMADGCDGVRAFYMGIDKQYNISSWRELFRWLELLDGNRGR